MKNTKVELSYDDLRKSNRRAHSELITLWEHLSHVSRETARRDLREDWGFRYGVTQVGSTLTFKDSHSGDTFTYGENGWD
jgi:hypothetical protein